MDPSTPAGLPSASMTRMDVTKTGLPRSGSNLSRSAATSTASLASTAGTSERSSGNASVVAGTPTTPASGMQRSTSTTDVLNSHAETLAVNDKVYVNGSKSGVIRFLGTTSFAPGKWAGVELDDESGGKNDGSVNSVRYFECPASRGIFVRPYRCTLEPVPDPMQQQPSSSRPVSPSAFGQKADSSADAADVSVKTSTSMTSTTTKPTGRVGGSASLGSFRVGMRVIVNASSGPKVGTVSYLGPVDFAPGAWVGVELDVAAGKNDGSVAGQRYFSCQPNYGLFAPMNKVQKYTDISTSVPVTVSNVQPASAARSGRLSTSTSSSSIHRPARVGVAAAAAAGRKTGPCGSQESLSSVTSSFSAKSGSSSRFKLGVTPLASSGSSKQPGKGLNGAAAAASTALREAICEKEEHISQLLKERDLERGEVARAASKVEEIESRLSSLQHENRKLLHQKEEELVGLKRCLSQEQLVQKELREQLDEEKRKLEVLEFRLEEEIVTRMELKDELDRLSAQSASSGGSRGETSSSMQSHRENDNEEEMFQLQEDVLRKDERIFELEHSLEVRKSEVANLQKRVKEFENQVKLFDDRQKNYLITIDDLNLKLKKVEDQNRKYEEECNKHRDVKRKLEDQVSELIGISGDNSGQVSDLKSDLKSKCDEVESLRAAVVKLTREVETSREAFKRLENNLQTELREKERRIEDLLISDQHLNIEIEKRDDIIKHLEDKIDDLISSSGNSSDHLAEMNLESKQKSQEIKRLEDEVFKLRNQIDAMDRNQERASEDNESMKKLISSKDLEINGYKELEIELKDKLMYMEETITRLKKQSVEDLKKKDQDVQQLQRRVEELLKASGDSGAQLVAMNEELITQKHTNSKYSDEIRTLRDQVSRLEKEKTTTSLHLEDSKKIVQKREEKIKELESKSAELDEGLRKTSEAKRKLELHLEDAQRRQDESSHHLDKLNEENREKQSMIKRLKESVKDLKDQLQKEEVEKKRLQAEVNETKRTIADADSQLDELNRSLLETEANFFKEIHEVKDQVGELQIEKEKLLRDIKANEAAIESRESTIEMLKQQLSNTRREFDDYRSDMNNLLKESQKDGDELVSVLRQEMRSIQTDNDSLRDMNAEMKVKMLNVVMEMENVQKRNAEVLTEFENECQRLESTISEKNRIIESKESVMDQMHNESEAKVEVMKKRLEAEKSILLKKIEDLETVMANASNASSPRSSGITTKTSIAITNRNASTSLTSSTSTSLMTQSVDDREQYEQQIEFLNSVIVDMQKKNDELKSKLQIMQEFGDVSGFEEGAERILKMNGHRRPPRLFCDICDVFDLHETEDCPQQCNLVTESNGHSKHNGSRSVEREYCASCEVFGHSTKDCDDRQSY